MIDPSSPSTYADALQGAPLLTPPVSPVTGLRSSSIKSLSMSGGGGGASKNLGLPIQNGFHYERDTESPKFAGQHYKLTTPPPSSDDGNGGNVLSFVDAKATGGGALVASVATRNTSVEGLALIARTDYGPGADQAITVPQKFAQVAREQPDAVAFYAKSTTDASWHATNYADYYHLTRTVAKAFLALGLQRYHSVAIMGFNSAEWFIANFAAIFAGGISTGIYSTNSSEACLHILNDCRANIFVVEDGAQLKKVLMVGGQLSHLKVIVQYRGQLDPALIGDPTCSKFKFMKWEDLVSFGPNTPDAALDDIIDSLVPGNCCSLIYTSGTTGNSKGVMISHDNLIWTAHQTARTLRLKTRHETFVSYLPLSHIAAQITDMYLTMNSASTVWFASPDALKGSLLPTLNEAKPTIFVGVPRVWEKIGEKMRTVSKSVTGVKRILATWAKNIGTKGAQAVMLGNPLPWGWWLADALVFSKVKRGLGFDRCRCFISTGAPTARLTIDYFGSLGIPIMEVYGMSECTGPATLNYCFPGEHWYGSSGLPLFGTNVRICYDTDDHSPLRCSAGDVGQQVEGGGVGVVGQAAGIGEICLKGRHVFMGYHNMERQTLDALDADGWLHTGDVGKLQKTKTGGPFLFITGRIKELIITAGGENIAPIPIEDAIKQELGHIVSNAMVVGDYKKFLSVLLTLKTEVNDLTGLPSDKLIPSVQEYIVGTLGHTGPALTSVQQIVSTKHPMIYKALQGGIDKANTKSISRAATIRKWAIVPMDFSIVGGELGPTMKLRRPIVIRKYGHIIESLYADNKVEEESGNEIRGSPGTASGSGSSILIETHRNGNPAFTPDE